MRKFVIILSLSLWVFLDVLSKFYFEKTLTMHEYIPIFWDFFGLKLSYNSGIAFSIPLEWWALKIITAIILLAIVLLYCFEEYKKKNIFIDIGYICILSWAISHAYERIVFWYVVDFLAVKYFAILNFADIFISVGAFFLLIAYGIYTRPRS